MLRRPKAGSFEAKLQTVQVSTDNLWRFSKFPDTEPFWAVSGRYRFDDPAGRNGGTPSFGVLYVGHLPEVAFAESALHENSLFNTATGQFEVSGAALRERSLVSFRHPVKTKLNMVDLTGEALRALGLNNDLSSGNRYFIPQLWSAAIHAARPDADGLRFTSRQLNTKACYAVFNRSGLVKDEHVPMPDDLLAKLCAKFNIVPV